MVSFFVVYGLVEVLAHKHTSHVSDLDISILFSDMWKRLLELYFIGVYIGLGTTYIEHEIRLKDYRLDEIQCNYI